MLNGFSEGLYWNSGHSIHYTCMQSRVALIHSFACYHIDYVQRYVVDEHEACNGHIPLLHSLWSIEVDYDD